MVSEFLIEEGEIFTEGRYKVRTFDNVVKRCYRLNYGGLTDVWQKPIFAALLKQASMLDTSTIESFLSFYLRSLCSGSVRSNGIFILACTHICITTRLSLDSS